MEGRTTPRVVSIAGVFILFLLLVSLLSFIANHNSLSWDEGDHIFAGYRQWTHGDFGLNPEHPPLVKAVAALPLLFLELKEPPLQNRYFKLEAYFDGRDMIFGSGPQTSSDTIVFLVRIAAAIFTVLTALLIYFMTAEIFGRKAGLFALLLFIFEPNILAHGALVTTDLAVSCFLLASAYAFYRYVKKPSIPRLILTGVAVGLALGSKHSAILILPILGILAIAEGWNQRQENALAQTTRLKYTLRLFLALGCVLLIAVGVLWSLYGFRYAARPEGLSIDPALFSRVEKLS